MSPKKADTLLAQANTLFLHKKFKEAILIYNKILKDNPRHTPALNNKGYALAKLGDHTHAISRCYDPVLEIQPNDRTAIINKVSSLRKLHKFEEALAHCETLLYDVSSTQLLPHHNNTTNNVVLYHKERILSALQRFEDCLDCCNIILFRYPDNPDVLFDKSCCLAHLHRPDESLDILKKLFAGHPQLKAKAKSHPALEPLHDNPTFTKLLM